jgi:hypothetical protein
MQNHFPKPSAPMGEAWFMGERKIRDYLMTVPPSAISTDDLHDCLWDIASGTSCFGHREEWEKWFRFLLPTLILRGHERWAFDFLIEHVATAFIQVFWVDIPEEYPSFRQDVSLAMCQHLMRSEFWGPHPQVVGEPASRVPRFLIDRDEGEEVLYGWSLKEAPGVFSAAMCTCLKYLAAQDIGSWVTSLLAIRHPYWRVAFLTWLQGAQDLLHEQIPRPSTMNAAEPRIGWEMSHVIEPDNPTPAGFNAPEQFLRPENTSTFLSEVRRHITPALLQEWENGFWVEPVLAGQPGLDKLTEAAWSCIAA